MKKLITLLFLFFPSCLYAQTLQGIILPESTFSNLSCDTLICIPKQKVETLMDREEIFEDLLSACEKRIAVCDSALLLKAREAESWHKKLLETDDQLNKIEIEKAGKERRNKVKTRIWFGTGVLVGILVGGR